MICDVCNVYIISPQVLEKTEHNDKLALSRKYVNQRTGEDLDVSGALYR